VKNEQKAIVIVTVAVVAIALVATGLVHINGSPSWKPASNQIPQLEQQVQG